MRILIFSPVFVSNPPQAEILQSWLEWQQIRNPGADILLIDNNSPAGFLNLVPALRNVKRQIIPDAAALPPLQSGLNLISFPDNIGTLELTGRDGWGRALHRAALLACDNNYDYLASISWDIFFPHALVDIAATVAQFKLGCLSTLRSVPYVMETGLAVMSCQALRERQFVLNYRWNEIRPPLMAEQVVEKILDPFYKSWFMVTDEKTHVPAGQIRPLHTIVRAHNIKLYEAFIRHYVPDWVLPSRRTA